jgi:hypothetical protein
MVQQVLSPTVHEATIVRHFARDPATRETIQDPILTELHNAMKSMREAGERASRLAAANLKNQMATPAANHKKAREASFAAIEGATKRFDLSVKLAQEAIAEIEKKTASPPKPKDVAGQLANMELRACLAGLPGDARSAALASALAAGDEAILAAVLTASPLLSGLSAGEYGLRLAEWKLRNHGEALERMGRLRKALTDVERAGPLLTSFVDGLTDAELVRAAEETSRAASEAAEG